MGQPNNPSYMPMSMLPYVFGGEYEEIVKLITGVEEPMPYGRPHTNGGPHAHGIPTGQKVD